MTIFSNRIIPALCLLLAPLAIFAQGGTDPEITKLFDGKAKIQWVRYFHGQIDDVTEVTLALGFDGTNCRGYLTYAESKLQLNISGRLDGGLFMLDESDSKDRITGHLTGTLQGDRLSADWTNATNSLGSRLEAVEVKSKTTPHNHCSQNKWVRRYISRWNNARVDFTLARVNNGLLNGYLWIEADDKTYTLKGRIAPDDKYQLQAILPNGKTAAHLQGSLSDPKSTDCLWVGSGEKRTIKMIQRYDFPVGCLEYADFATSFDAIFPKINDCSACNETLEKKVTDWIAQCKTAMETRKKGDDPEHRNALRASSWYEVTCWTETIFCGYLTFAESWKSQTTGLSFNFDLRTGKEIIYEDLFNKSFNAKEWFAEYARKEMPKISKFADDPAFREWLQKDGFPMFTIRRDGLELSTLFHPIYGQYNLTVPYQILKPYMRRDNPVTDLVK